MVNSIKDSLNKTFDDLVYLLKCTNKNSDITAVSETRISEETSLSYNVKLNNNFLKSILTESTAGGTMLFISNHLSFKPIIDLNMYKENQLESTFIKIFNSSS